MVGEFHGETVKPSTPRFEYRNEFALGNQSTSTWRRLTNRLMYLAWIATYHLSCRHWCTLSPKPREAAIARAEHAAPRAPQLIDQMEAEDGHRSKVDLTSLTSLTSHQPSSSVCRLTPGAIEAKAKLHFHGLNVTLRLRSLVSA